MDNENIHTNRPKDKKVNDYSQSLTSEMWYKETCKEKKNDDLPALWIVLMHLNKDSSNTLKWAKKDKLQQPFTAMTI